MTEQRITLLSIDHNAQKPYQKGGTYPATIVYYADANGQAKDITVATSFLANAGALSQQLLSAVPNTSCILVTEKNGKYTNLIGLLPDDGRQLQAAPPTAAPSAQYQNAGRSGGGGKSFDNVGAQIGNAITNAATISPAGTTLEDLAKTAEGIIRMGEILKQRHIAGAYAPQPPAAPAPVQQVAPPVVQPPVANGAVQGHVVVDGGTAFSTLIGQ